MRFSRSFIEMWKFKDTGLKLLLLAVGIWEFTPYFPDSLDLYDKILTSIILLYFWFKFGTSDFIFGKKSRFLNAFILIAFYVLSLDTFVKFAEQAGIVVDGSMSVFSFLVPVQSISLFSISVGTLLLLLISIYASFKPLGLKSFSHALYSVSVRKGWERFNSSRLFRPLKFLFIFVSLFIVSQYFFHLVTQWFVVSLDKSLLIMSFLFAIKDLERSKVGALKTLGNIDDVILNTVRDLFTSSRTFFMGVGFLLMFHILSDLSVFFIPYFLNLSFDPYYFSYLPVRETLASLMSGASALLSVSYVFSAIGSVLILVLPIFFCFIFSYDLSRLADRLLFRLCSVLSLFFVLWFIFSPWLSMSPISSGIYGVDFMTHSVSLLPWLFLLVPVFLLALLFNRVCSRYSVVLLFFSSFIYLGLYVWNFFRSSMDYYLSSALQASLSGSFIPLVFLLLAFLDLVFYVGGFAVFTYYSSRYIVRNLERLLLNDPVIIGASFLIVLLSMFFIFFENYLLVLITVLVGVLFNLSFFFFLKGRQEFRDDFILAVTFLIGVFVLLSLVSVRIQDAVFSLVSPVVVLSVVVFLLRFFRLSVSFSPKFIRWRFVVLSVVLGLLFGAGFVFLGEPVPSLLSGSFLYVVFLALVIAFSEEFFFRFVLLRLGEKGFGFVKALFVQAGLFCLIHVMNFEHAFFSFGLYRLLAYLVLLFSFSIVAALLTGSSAGRRFSGNIVYAIVLHWLANVVLFSNNILY